MTRDNNKKTHYVVLGGKGGGQAESVEWNDILNKPEFATVATTGDYDDLNDKPTILTQWFGTQAEYDAIVTKDPNVIYNIEGSDNVQPDWNQTDTTADDYIKNKPTIPAAQVNADWNATSGVAQILNKPTIPAAQVNSDWNSNSGVSQILNKPIIPAAQVNSDWDANSGVAQILNKPNLATVATSGSYNSLKNKPTVPDDTETLTFTLQGGTTVTMDVYVKPDYAKTYFFVQDLSGNGSTLTFQAMDNDVNDFDLYTSTDQQTWTLAGRMEMFAYFQVPIPANGKLYIKATTDRWGSDEWFESDFPYAVGGNLMSLLFGDNFENVTALTSVNTRCFNFHGDNNLYDASKLVLPATTLTDECYFGMFQGCTSLTTAPKVLPATTLTVGCYSSMFYGCTSLAATPALPATTLAESCYSSMFSGCTSLTTAPELPATTLAPSCYNGMFDGCTSLNKMSVYATDISAMDCTTNWLNNVSATGGFFNNGGASYTRDASGIPAGWDVIN